MTTAQKKLAASDPVLGEIIHSIPEPTITSTNQVFSDLMSCILEQQIHYRSTKKIFQKMLEAASLEILTPENFEHFEACAFSQVQLSRQKYETVLRVLNFWRNNIINWHLLPDEEVRTKLLSIKGIGCWTVDMILLYTLQRPNIFPADDFHLKNIMTRLYELNPKTKLAAQMKGVAHNWGEQKSLAVKYLLAWKDYLP